MNEYRITADLEKLFGKEIKLGRFQEYLTCTIGDHEPIVIGKVVKRKSKKMDALEALRAGKIQPFETNAQEA